MSFYWGEIPFLLNSDAKKAFVLGYGGGTTVRALAMNKLETIDVVELDSAVLDAVRTLYDGNLPTQDDQRVNIEINDARNSLLMSEKSYDIIVSQPSHPWLNGASNVMNKDFFEIVKKRLSVDGIYAQWVPLSKIDVSTLKSIIKAYTDTFEHVISFVNISTNNFLMFGSKSQIVFDYNIIKKEMQNKQVVDVFKNHNILGPYDLMRYFALSREQLVSVSNLSKAASDTNLLTEVYRSKYSKTAGNSFNTLEFLKKHISYDISSYLGNQGIKKLYEQYYFFDYNGYKNEAKLLKKSTQQTFN